MLMEVGIRILDYLDDWLILAHSRDQFCEHRDLELRHLSHLWLQVNWKKSKLFDRTSTALANQELLAVLFALSLFRPLLQGKHVLVRTGQHCDCCVHRALRWIYHNSPATSSGVSSSSSHCPPFTFQRSSFVRPTRSHDS